MVVFVQLNLDYKAAQVAVALVISFQRTSVCLHFHKPVQVCLSDSGRRHVFCIYQVLKVVLVPSFKFRSC